MSGTCVIGLQWGDEAKGKLVDLLAPRFDCVIRYQGGANAGHTVVVGDEVYKLHHIPSGILHSDVQNFITPGVVINPTTMLQEIDGLAARGINVADNLKVSDRAHLVMPWHMIEDATINTVSMRGESIGTTNRGIGPCYRDKVGRTHAIRMIDLMQAGRDERIATVAEQKTALLRQLGASDEELAAISPDKMIPLAASWAERLAPLIADTTDMILDAAEADQTLLFEGAQGALLDIDHGTYPFVTSSNSSGVGVCAGAGVGSSDITSSNSSGVGVCAGAGVPPKWIDHVLGVCKAYSTRVGGGPFPTELSDETGDKIRKLGNEFGTTTGRPRRCGWFDAVAVRYTARLSGVSRLALMMMDVLAHFEELQVCVAYELDGKEIHHMPSHADQLRRCKPIFETIPGWNSPVDHARSMSDFPAGALAYVKRIEELVGVPVGVLSVGPDRSQTIFTPEAEAMGLA